MNEADTDTSPANAETVEQPVDTNALAGERRSRSRFGWGRRARRARLDPSTDATARAAIPQPGNGASDVDSDEPPPAAPATPRRWRSALAYGVVPALALLLALGVGYLKYDVTTAQNDERAARESTQAAKEGTVAILSYTPETAQTSLSAARNLLTGTFRDSYTSLTHDVVIPGAQQQEISATATVAAAASVSATTRHSVVLVFVNQALTIGQDAPASTASVVEVSLDHLDGRWLISGFDPK
jgi:Mce-associated membrane protein